MKTLVPVDGRAAETEAHVRPFTHETEALRERQQRQKKTWEIPSTRKWIPYLVLSCFFRKWTAMTLRLPKMPRKLKRTMHEEMITLCNRRVAVMKLNILVSEEHINLVIYTP